LPDQFFIFEIVHKTICICFFLEYVYLLLLFNSGYIARRGVVMKIYSAELQQAVQAAHDIRSPLTALSLLEKDLGLLPSQTRQLAKEALARIHGIAQKLLDVQRMAQPKALQDADLVELSSRLVLAKKIEFSRRPRLTVEFAPPPGCAPLIAAVEPLEFQCVLSNLINNAAEAIPDAGDIRISITREGGEMHITVTDNGVGLENSRNKTAGNGLGLPHARAQVREWNGSFHIESLPHAGTAAVIRLPAQERS
jgi:signal transduction histidine kinase